MNGISGVSGLSGGNCTREEHEEYRRMFAGKTGWDGTFPESQEAVSEDEERRTVIIGGVGLTQEQMAALQRALDTPTPQSQEPVSDADLGQLADTQAWLEERS